MLSDVILIGGFLYLAVAIRGQTRHIKRMELRLDVRITSVETQIGDLQDRLGWIEDNLTVSRNSLRGTVPEINSFPEVRRS